jgi:hypothetical protein
VWRLYKMLEELFEFNAKRNDRELEVRLEDRKQWLASRKE